MTGSETNTVHDRVVSLLRDWNPDVNGPERVRSKLRGALVAAVGDVARVKSRYDSDGADFVVGGIVGVFLFREVTVNTVRRFRLAAVSDVIPYDSVVVYGYRLAERHLDRWRVLDNRLDADRLGLDALAFVRGPPTESAADLSARGKARYVEPVLGIGLLLVGLVVLEAAGVGFGTAEPAVVVLVVGVFVLLLFVVWGQLRSIA